jgi:Lrp/AsnC family transcriptional regulator for asnA, asnC and gidA
MGGKMSTIDEIDEKIARHLGQDAQQSAETLAKKLKISAATVRRRIKKLMDNNLLRIIGVVDLTKLGYPLAALLTLDVVHEKIEPVIAQLAKRPEVRVISITAGRYDVMAFARFRSNEDLAKFLKEKLKIDGVKDCETYICLDVQQKGAWAPMP